MEHQVVIEDFTRNTRVFRTNWDICARSQMQLHFPVSVMAILEAGDVGGRILDSLNISLAHHAENIGFITIEARCLAISVIREVEAKELTYITEMVIAALCHGFEERGTLVDVFTREYGKHELHRHGKEAYSAAQF